MDRGATEEQARDLTEDEADEHTFIGLKSFQHVEHVIPQFREKAWILFEACSGSSFYISNNPVVLHNDNDYGPYGNLGTSVKGIEIYFPLSSALCLALYCPTLADQIMETSQKIKDLDKISPAMTDRIYSNSEAIRDFSHGLENGIAITVNSENVKMMNSLQVTFSIRYVYDEKGDFSVVKDMIEHSDEYRGANRAKIC